MLQYQPEEIGRPQSACFPLPGSPVFIAEGHLIVLQAQDIALTDDAPVEVAGKVGQSRIAPTDALTLHHPGFGQPFWQPIAGILHGCKETGSKDFRQRQAIEQVLPGTGFPAQARAVQTATGHNDMQVRVVVQFTAVGVQYGGQSQSVAQRRIVPAKGLKRVGRHPEQGRVGPFRVCSGKAAQSGRQSKGHQIIGHRQQLLPLSIQPLVVGAMLTGRAGPVPA